jgi:hypothetical protein
MSINLEDIRTAVMNYVDSNVTITITNLISAGTTINPGEGFSLRLNAANASASNGGIPLKNVVWYVLVQDDAVAKLIVPDEPYVTRSKLSKSSPKLTPGTQVNEMYIFPRAVDNYLGVGDTDSLTISCKAGSGSTGGACFIFAKLYASVDEAWLFPKDQDSITQGRYIEVVG